MADNDDQLIRHFLAPGRQEVPDHGFSERVMHRLPHKAPSRSLLDLWTACCAAVAVVIIIACNGVTVVLDALSQMLTQVLQTAGDRVWGYDVVALTVTSIVLIVLGYQQAVRLTD